MKLLLALAFPLALAAQDIKRIPPPGIEVPAADRAEIEAGVKQLGDAIASLKKDAAIAGEIPNVEIFHKSADWALRYNEIFDAKQIPIAKDHIKQGLERAAALTKGATPWNTQTGLVVRAYRSKIDGSVQPYGLVIPADWKPDDGKERGGVRKRRLDFWCHGRNEKLSELAFIADRQKNPGEFVPEGAIVCHLYGRYCNANKFAGEMDLFEALDDIKRHYPIDERRLVIRGFSMGGAACWQFATHFPGMWAAAAPGAGFAETAEFFKVFAPGKEAPPAWEQKLWRWYDCTTMAANLANTSVVAYSGEIDGQKQAADIMVKYAAQEGITFPHIIGAKMGHKYDDASKAEIEKLVTAAVEKGNEEFPRKVRFATYSLIYPRAETVWIQGMEKSWERADVNYDLADDGHLTAATKNVSYFLLMFRDTQKPAVKVVTVDGQKVSESDGCTFLALKKVDGKWARLSDLPDAAKKASPLQKQFTLCGPIDHAFMSRFVFVRPTGKPLNNAVGAWTKAEMDRAIAQWRQVFRGDVTVVDDTGADSLATDANLVVWGDISSNKAIAKIAAKLPLKWDATTLALGTQKVDAAHHAPIMIYPNPLNPGRYIVLNSGPTFREAAALNNSDQTPKLPDWAVVDLRTPPGPKWPGKIVDAGFFDENWK
jgi:dienelactone hydrolase